MATSGAVDTIAFDARQVIDRAFRACRIDPQMIAGEMLSNAKDSLNLMLASLPHAVTSAWTRDTVLVGIPMNQTALAMPVGTTRIISASYRSIQRLTGSVVSSDAQAATAIFDGDFATYLRQSSGGGSLTITLAALATVSCLGYASTDTSTGVIDVLTSANGSTWTLRASLSGGFTPYRFVWLDLDPSIDTQYVRLTGRGSYLLSVSEVVIGGAFSEIPLNAIPQDQFNALTTTVRRSSRPVLFYQQRTAAGPVMNLWPQVDASGTFGLISVVRDRSVQDVIDLTDALEVPKIWVEAIILGLAYRLALDDPKIDPSVVQMLKPMADDYKVMAMRADGDGTGWTMGWDLRGYQ